jgi:hypothetical protein
MPPGWMVLLLTESKNGEAHIYEKEENLILAKLI